MNLIVRNTFYQHKVSNGSLGAVRTNEVHNGLQVIDDVDGIDNAYRNKLVYDFDALYLNRRPRKMLTWQFQRRMLRELGDMIEGDYSRVPEHRVNFKVAFYQQDRPIRDVIRFKWDRRPRTAAGTVPIWYDLTSAHARFK